MEAAFCIEVLEEELKPDIFNTDQGNPLPRSSRRLQKAEVAISMDGKARGIRIFVERLWRLVKYKKVHLRAPALSEASVIGFEFFPAELRGGYRRPFPWRTAQT